MKLSTPILKIFLFAINKYGKELLSERLNISLLNYESLFLRAANQKKETRRRIYYKEDGTFHAKKRKLDKIGKSETWQFDDGIAILKPLSIMDKIRLLFTSVFAFVILPIKKLVNAIIDDIGSNIPKPIIWLYIFMSSVLGILSSVIETVLSIIIVLFTLKPYRIIVTIFNKVLSLLFSILLQLFLAISAPFFIAIFTVFVDIFAKTDWLKRMIVGILRAQYADNELVVIPNNSLAKIEHVIIKRSFSTNLHGVVVKEGDTNKHGILEALSALVVPEYWRGSSHVFRVKNADEAASLIAFLEGTYVVKQARPN